MPAHVVRDVCYVLRRTKRIIRSLSEEYSRITYPRGTVLGAIWVRRGLESQSCNVGVLSTRKIGRLQI